MHRPQWLAGVGLAVLLAAGAPQAATKDPVEARAEKIVDSMTLDEQIALLRVRSAMSFAAAPGAEALPERVRVPKPEGSVGSAGYVPAMPRVGLPALQESDAGLGVANFAGIFRPGDEATALPSSLALAATFDPALAHSSGQVVGAEAHAKGFNVQLAGGVNLARDPRNGRNFEYVGEDPLLAGRIAGASVAGIQSQHVVSTVKHYALNGQESGRMVYSVRIGEAAARESDLLAFQIAIEDGNPGSVMCAYNRINGDYACENDFLLNQVLKRDWGYRGWVMSDWGASHSFQKSVRNGLDQLSPQDDDYFAGLKAAVEKGEISRARLRDMALRVIRPLVMVGALDNPAKPGGTIDRARHAAIAQETAEKAAVLLKNDGLLPLAPGKRKIVLIGGHADEWVLTGGGSSQVNPYGGLAYDEAPKQFGDLFKEAYIKSSPLKALRALRPDLEIVFDDGKDPARAAAAAKGADAALVFAVKASAEGSDSADLSLPYGQDALIAAVAAANPRTGVVLETGNPIAMPWLSQVGAVLQVWYPGQRGGDAIAALLSGKVSPSGRLPITFPNGVQQLPRPKLDGFELQKGIFDPPPPLFDVDYDKEGSDVGYRWFERTKAEPLFPFGHGLTYTTFRYDGLRLSGGKKLVATLTLTNTGERAGVEVAQLYVAPPGRTHRLAGWARVPLKSGESRKVTIEADPRLLASWEAAGWKQAKGTYDVWVSPSAKLSGLHSTVQMTGQ